MAIVAEQKESHPRPFIIIAGSHFLHVKQETRTDELLLETNLVSKEIIIIITTIFYS